VATEGAMQIFNMVLDWPRAYERGLRFAHLVTLEAGTSQSNFRLAPKNRYRNRSRRIVGAGEKGAVLVAR